MKHKRFEENILVDEAYTNYGKVDENADSKKSQGIAKHFADTLEYEEKKKWYHQMPEEPSTITKTVTSEQIEELRKEASSALLGDTTAYETKSSRGSSSDHQWAKTLLNKGAIGDRVAAATILIQDNPIHNLTALKNLINNVKPSKKKDGIVIIDALSELLISDLLIPDAKLRAFAQRPLGHIEDITSGNKAARRSVLKLWYYEDQLKELYATYIEALNKFAHDTVDANKEKAVSAMSYLLMHHPEREKTLLGHVINKLGDPSTAVSSKVIYHLCQLLFNHPNMKAVVLAEIEKMLFRSNIAPRAQYYGVCFLNQFFLGKDDSSIAENLIRIYFSFFKASIKKGEIDTRLMAAILTGVKRAYPFADRDRLAAAPEHVDAIHKLVHLANLNIAIHALALLFHISDASKGTSDRYYTALYRKLTNSDIFNTTHSALLFSLIYKSLKQDKDVPRVTAFIKRLLQLCCYMTPAQACGMLFLISQVLKDGDKRDAVKLTWAEVKGEVVKTDPEERQEVADAESATKEDADGSAVDGTLDSSVEVNGTVDPEQERDAEEKEQKKVDLLRGDKKDLLIDDDEETYVDLKIDDQGNIKPKRRRHAAVPAGWFHARVRTGDEVQPQVDRELDTKIQLKKTINLDKVVTSYDRCARNPSFAGADRTAYIDLLPLTKHFHPTVKLFADKLVNEQLIQYSGDPLKDFAGIRFLERFVFKNPKRRPEPHGGSSSAKTVRGSHPKFAVRKNYVAKGIKSLPVNSASYLNEDVKKIPVDERFLYDFLQKRRAQRSEDSDEDSRSVCSEDFDEYLDNMPTAGQAEPDEDLDYLADMEATRQSRPRAGSPGAELGSEGSGGSGDEGGSDGELDISDEDGAALSGEEDELMLEEDSDSDADADDDVIDLPGKGGKGKMKLKLKGKDDLSSLFASAEEFSTLLEDTATNSKQGSSQAVSNADNSSTKQLAWEDNRDRWIKGYNRKILGNKIKAGNKSRGTKFNKQPGNTHNKMAAKGKRKGGNLNVGGKRKRN